MQTLFIILILFLISIFSVLLYFKTKKSRVDSLNSGECPTCKPRCEVCFATMPCEAHANIAPLSPQTELPEVAPTKGVEQIPSLPRFSSSGLGLLPGFSRSPENHVQSPKPSGIAISLVHVSLPDSLRTAIRSTRRSVCVRLICATEVMIMSRTFWP